MHRVPDGFATSLNFKLSDRVPATLGSRGYFFLIDTSRRSRVNEARSAEEKKKSCLFRLFVYLDLCLSLQVFAFKLDQIAARNIRISLDKPIAFSK